MKNRTLVIYMVLSSLVFSCKSQNKENTETMNDPEEIITIEIPYANKKVRTNRLTYSMFQPGKKYMEDCNFKPPSYKQFKDIIQNVFKIDLDTIKYYGWCPDKDEPLSFVEDERYINASSLSPDPDGVDVNSPFMCSLNKMIFYNDLHATNWIKMNEPQVLVDIIKHYGYTGNKNWLQFVFSKVDFLNQTELGSLIFDELYFYEGPAEYAETGERLGGTKKYKLRHDMVEKLIELQPGDGLTLLGEFGEHMLFRPEEYVEEPGPVEEAAYIFDACIRGGVPGHVEFLYDKDIKWKEKFKSNNYFGLKDLREYSDTIYKPSEDRKKEDGRMPRARAVINDPDGYTNVRKERSSSSAIVFQIREGEEFIVEIGNPKDQWWQVTSPKYGYIHKSRVKIVEKLDD